MTAVTRLGIELPADRRKCLGLAEDRRRVEPAAHRDGHRMRGSRPPPHGARRTARETRRRSPRTFETAAVASCRSPSTAYARNALRRHRDEVRGDDRGDAPKAGELLTIERTRADQHEVGEPLVIRLRRDVGVREERLDLRGEREQTRAVKVVQRTDADRIARENEALAAGIEDRRQRSRR